MVAADRQAADDAVKALREQEAAAARERQAVRKSEADACEVVLAARNRGAAEARKREAVEADRERRAAFAAAYAAAYAATSTVVCRSTVDCGPAVTVGGALSALSDGGVASADACGSTGDCDSPYADSPSCSFLRISDVDVLEDLDLDDLEGMPDLPDLDDVDDLEDLPDLEDMEELQEMMGDMRDLLAASEYALL
jgi:hypothetical protein